MQRIFYYTLSVLMLIASLGFAQAPAQFNYQAVARDANGTPISEKNIAVRIRILDGSASGNQVHDEIFTNVKTNKYGLFNLAIGSTRTMNITWSSGAKFIEVSIDPNNGVSYTIVGSAQLLSVPYALYSNTAGWANGGGNASTTYVGGTGIQVNGNTIVGLNTSNIWNAGQIQGVNISPNIPQNGNILVFSGSSWSPLNFRLTPGGATAISGDIINGFTITSPSAISYTTGTGIAINGNVISNTSPAANITLQPVGGGISITGSYPTWTISVPSALTPVLFSPTPAVSINGLNFSISTVTGSQSGLMSTGQSNTLQQLSTLVGFDIQNGGGVNISRTGSVYTLSVPTTTGFPLGLISSPQAGVTFTGSGSVTGGNLSINIANVNSSQDGLMPFSEFNRLSTITGVNINGGNGIAISGGYPNFTITNTAPSSISPWTTSGSNVYYQGGNVGIGTPNPSTDLDVRGNALISGNVTLAGFNGAGIRRLGVDANGQIVSGIGILNMGDITTSSPLINISGGQNAVNGTGVIINIPTASSTSGGLLTQSDFNLFSNKQDVLIQGPGIVINGNTISATGSSFSSQNLSLTGDVLTISGGNSVNLPVASIAGIGVTVNNLGGGTIEIINPFTSTGVGYFANTQGVFVNSVTGAIGLAVASVDGYGILSSSDYTKLQSLSSTSLVGSNVTLVSSTGNLTTYSIGGSSLGSQNLSLNGDVLTISGGNSVNLPVASISGVGLTVNNLGGGTIEIVNPFTSTGIGYFANTSGVFVNSVTGAIGLAIANVDGYGILNATEYTKLQTLTGVNLVQGSNININSDLSGNYTITGVATPGTFTTVTGTGPIRVDNTNPQSPVVSVLLASSTGPGVVSIADYQKLQRLENVSVAGFGVTTTLGPNNILTYQIPSAGTGTVTTVTGLGAINVSNGGTTPIISIASADGINAGTLSPADYIKLQSLSSTSLVGSNVTLVSSSGSLTTYSIGGSSLGSQNLSLTGDVLTISGGNSINLPVTSLTGVGLTVNNLGGGNIQIVNPFTSTGIGYFSTSTGLLNVSSTSGAIGLGFLPASIVGTNINVISGPTGFTTYSIGGSALNSQNLGLTGNVLTISGGNSINLPVTSVVGLGLTVTTLAGGVVQISNPFTSTGIGYFSTSTGLLNVSSTTGAIGLGFAPTSIVGLAISTTNGPNGYTTYSISGLNNSFTTLTGIGSLVTVTGGLGSYSVAGIAPVLTLSGNVLGLVGGNQVTLTGIGSFSTSGGVHAFHVRATPNQTYNGGAYETIEFDPTPITDVSVGWNSSNHSYRIPEAGYYYISTGYYNTGFTQALIGIFNNNNPLSLNLPGLIPNNFVEHSGVYYFNEGDIITARFQDITTLPGGNISDAYFTGFKINGGGTSTISGGGSVGLSTTTSFSGDVTGLYNTLTLTSIQGYPIQGSPLFDGDVLQFVSSSSSFVFDQINGSSQWLDAGTDIYYQAGNVGIGTASPTALLDVQGTNNTVLSSFINYGTGVAVQINSNGTGLAASSNGNNEAALIGYYTGSNGTGVLGYIDGSASGNAGRFININSANSFPTLYVGTESIEPAIYVESSVSGVGIQIGKGSLIINDLATSGAPVALGIDNIGQLVTIAGGGSGITLTGLGLSSVTGGPSNYTIIGLLPTLTINGNTLSLVGGSPVTIPSVSVAGTQVSIVPGPAGFTTYSLSGANVSNLTAVGLNGIQATALGQSISVDGINFITSIVGLNGLTINKVGQTVSVSASNFTTTSVVGNGVSLVSTIGGINTYSIGGTAFVPTSITGLAGLTVSSSGQSFSISGANFISTSSNSAGDVSGNFLNGFTVTGLRGAPINTSLISPSYLLQFDGSSVVGFNPSNLQTSITGIGNLVTVTGGLGNYTIAGITPVLSLSGANLSIVGGSQQLPLPLASVVGSNVFTVTGPNGFTTYSVSSQAFTPTSITGLAGLTVSSSGQSFSISGANFITSIVGVNGLSINQLGSTYTISGPNITSVAGVGVTLLTSPGLNTFSITGGSQWISTGAGIVYNSGNVGINALPTSNALEVLQTTTASAIVGVIQSAGGFQSAIGGIVQSGGTGSTAIYGQSSVTGANIIMVNRDQNTTLFKVTTSGQVQIATMSSTGTRFVFADPNGNLVASTATGLLQGTNNGTSNSVAYFDANTNTITGNQAFTFQPVTSTLGVNNIALGTQSVVGTGAVIVYLRASVALTAGDLVVTDVLVDNSAITSSQQGNTAILGVAFASCAASSVCPIAISGVVPVRANASVVRGQHCIVSATAGSADSIPSPNPGSSIGVFISGVTGGFANVLLK